MLVGVISGPDETDREIEHEAKSLAILELHA